VLHGGRRAKLRGAARQITVPGTRALIKEEWIMSDPASSQARRRFLKIAVVGVAIAPVAASLLPRIARADDPHLDPNDATAKQLGYTEDASTAKGDPVFKPNSACVSCNFFKGHSEMAYAPCDLFPGKAVSSKGWCKSWTARP
jgi:hypothetical protein